MFSIKTKFLTSLLLAVGVSASVIHDTFTVVESLANKVCPSERRLSEVKATTTLSCLAKAGRWNDCTGVSYQSNTNMCYICDTYQDTSGIFSILAGATYYQRSKAVPDGYTNVAGYILKIVSLPALPYADAKVSCAEFGSLVRIDTEDKQNQIRALLNDTINGNTASGYWIQLEIDQADSVWKFSDGTAAPMDNTFWYPGQPDGGYNPSCGQLWRNHGYMWDDTDCEIYRGYICESV